MKKIVFTSFILLSLLTLIVLTACGSRIPVTEYSQEKSFTTKKNISKTVQFSILQTGRTSSLEGFLYSGGSFFKSKPISHIAVLVKHKKGTFLFDTGLGDSIARQFQDMSFLHRQLFKFSKGASVRQQLLNAGVKLDTIQSIVLSHLHWDHSSGIKDFPNATVYTTREELDFAQSIHAESPAFLKSQYTGAKINWQFLPFEKKNYATFEESCDFFGDGSVVFVKLPGHTNGSIGMFINGSKSYFFTGDVTWKLEGFKNPSPKHFIPRMLVDLDKLKLNATIVKIHNLIKNNPELLVIPAHDYEVQKNLQHFPKFQ